MPNSLFNQVQWCQATIGASSKATSPKAGGTAGSPWRAAAGRKGAKSGAGAVFAGHGLMFVVSGSCWVLCCGWCNGTDAQRRWPTRRWHGVWCATGRQSSQSTGREWNPGESQINGWVPWCDCNEFAAIEFPNATIRVLVINGNQISNGICCLKNWGPSPSWSINQKWWSGSCPSCPSCPSNFIGCHPRVAAGTGWASQWWEPLVGLEGSHLEWFCAIYFKHWKFMNIPVRWQWFGATTTRFIFSKKMARLGYFLRLEVAESLGVPRI